MGKRIKLREAQRRAVEEAIASRLRANSRVKAAPAFIEFYGQFDACYREQIETYRELAVRAPDDWRCRLRSRAPERRFLELVEFTFARYSVADHLKNAWVAPADARHDLAAALGIFMDDVPDLRQWYIVAASGGSLYKEATHPYLTKLETHHFVSAPAEVTPSVRAFWFAIARAANDNAGVALKVSRSKLAGFPVVAPFWKEVARFFARNPLEILEMNDLIDYLAVERRVDPGFSLKGRSLPALCRRMAEWHRMLQDIACGGRWNGHRLPDVTYGGASGEPTWRFRQIKTGEELADEGRRMAHCVATYKEQCVRGVSSIWSLSRECGIGQVENLLTIELASDRSIVQCRGRHNRGADAEEVAVVKRWAADQGLSWFEWIW